jgi:CubicO group peptidase (beta-lactamase class C family)
MQAATMNDMAPTNHEQLADDVTALLQRGVTDHVFPGAVAAVAMGEETFVVARGRETYDSAAPATNANALFDIASLTKVVATTTAVMQLLEANALSLDDSAAQFLHKLDQPGKKEITIRHLMTHTAGFPGPYQFYRFCRTREQLIEAVYAVDLVDRPGSRRLYDDISFILLAFIVEKLTDMSFDRYCSQHIFTPLQMTNTGFRPQVGANQIIPTEIDPDRGGLQRGVVHDENAYVLGGVAGHAGLFSRASDLMRFAVSMSAPEIGVGVLSDASIRRLRQCEWRDHEGEYGLGWDRVRRHYMGAIDDEDTIGHTGFTGTSMVISPRRARAVILLSNRVHPTRSDPGAINAVRRELMQLVQRHRP